MFLVATDVLFYLRVIHEVCSIVIALGLSSASYHLLNFFEICIY